MPKNKKSNKGTVGNSNIPKYVKKDTVPLENPDFINGEFAPFASQVNWMQNYVNSPKYRQRMGNFYTNPDPALNQRRQILNNVEFRHVNTTNPNDVGVYNISDNTIRINPSFSRMQGLDGESTKVHELGHAMYLTPQEESYLLDRESTFGKNSANIRKFAKDNKIGISDAITQYWRMHDYAPNELKSDIDAFRYLMNREGIYDAGTQDMNKEFLEKARSNRKVSNDFLFKRLQRHYNDNDLIDIMNKVASNNQSSSNAAYYGANINSGTMKYANGGSITPLSGDPTSQGIFRFNGPSHERGGIPINYNGSQVEVEGDETGYIDMKGDLNIFGNMYVPGTKKKFKSVSKDIAAAESKAQSRLRRSSDLMNEIEDFDDPMERLKANSASVMGKSAINQQQEAAKAKENLADLQNRMLDYSNAMGMSPKKLFGKADRGASVPLRDRKKKEEEILQPFVPDYYKKYGPVPINIPYDRLGYDLDTIQTARASNPKVDAKLTSSIPSVQSQRESRKKLSFDNPEYSIYNEPLSFGQIAPELYTLATNRQEFVPSQFYTPQLYQNYRVSFQDRLNQNNSTFRAIGQSVVNNPAAASQLAAQKYNADQQVLGEEFRTNQSIQDQITNRNVELINQAQLANINMGRENAELRAQNAAATRTATREALRSIAGKSEQMKQYNRGLTLYAQMMPHYRFDPDTGQWNFESQGPADINVGGYNAGAEIPNLYGESRITDYDRDSKGRVLRRSEQRTPGLLKIFKRR